MKDYKFEEEETWKLARELAWDVYGVTSHDAFESDYRVRNSVRRASFAIMANVAEGIERDGTLEFVRYLAEARDEVEALRQQLEMAHENGFINNATLARLIQALESLGCIISSLMTSINQEFISPESMSVSYHSE